MPPLRAIDLHRRPNEQIFQSLPDRNRTCNPRLRRPVLYPVELRADRRGHRGQALVGVERFELPTSCSQSKRATGLRYTPRGANNTYPFGSRQTGFKQIYFALENAVVRTYSCILRVKPHGQAALKLHQVRFRKR